MREVNGETLFFCKQQKLLPYILVSGAIEIMVTEENPNLATDHIFMELEVWSN